MDLVEVETEAKQNFLESILNQIIKTL